MHGNIEHTDGKFTSNGVQVETTVTVVLSQETTGHRGQNDTRYLGMNRSDGLTVTDLEHIARVSAISCAHRSAHG